MKPKCQRGALGWGPQKHILLCCIIIIVPWHCILILVTTSLLCFLEDYQLGPMCVNPVAASAPTPHPCKSCFLVLVSHIDLCSYCEVQISSLQPTLLSPSSYTSCPLLLQPLCPHYPQRWTASPMLQCWHFVVPASLPALPSTRSFIYSSSLARPFLPPHFSWNGTQRRRVSPDTSLKECVLCFGLPLSGTSLLISCVYLCDFFGLCLFPGLEPVFTMDKSTAKLNPNSHILSVTVN